MPLLKPTEKENLNFIKKEELQAGPAEKFSKRGTDPPLLKRSGGRGGGGGREVLVVGLWTFKMVYLVPTEYFLIQLQLVNHLF